MTRFDNSVKVIDLNSKQEIGRSVLPNPEPESIVAGRPLLYDATRFSGNGEASCASCHIFGDMDDLAWDLGNPDEVVTKNPIPINFGDLLRLGLPLLDTPINGTGAVDDFHPMKGPMTTQTLRGLRNSGAMHWRGDRANGAFGVDPFDPELSFNNFIVAFEGLAGSPDLPSAAEMQRFTDFQLQVIPPPNPVRRLDNSLTAAQQRGRDFYFGPRPADGIIIPGVFAQTFTCNGCHVLDPAQGFFGTGRDSSFENHTQIVKIPHLRNQYAKVGMFGAPKLSQANAWTAGPRIDLMIQRAEAPFISKALGGAVRECDLVANVALGGRVRTLLYDPVDRKFVSEDGKIRLPDLALRALALIVDQEVIYTCLPPGSGARIMANP